MNGYACTLFILTMAYVCFLCRNQRSWFALTQVFPFILKYRLGGEAHSFQNNQQTHGYV